MRLLPLIPVGCALVAAASSTQIRRQSVANITWASNIDTSYTTTTARPVSPSTAGVCRDYADRPGTCGTIHQCAALSRLVSGGRRPTAGDIANLRASTTTCGGFRDKQLLICCAHKSPGPFAGEPEDHPNIDALGEKHACGTTFISHIVGGSEVAIGEFPWLATIGYTGPSVHNGDGKIRYTCSGVLISDRHVLTAAHCVTGIPNDIRPATIHLGKHNLDTEVDCETSFSGDVVCTNTQDFQIADIIIHAGYRKPVPRTNDIALVKLDRPVSLDTFVHKICLPFGDLRQRIYTVAGFASFRDDTGDLFYDGPLEKVTLTGAAHDVCEKKVLQRGALLGPRQLCADQPRRDLCFGDSGAPLMAHSLFGQINVIGLVSYGDGTCLNGVPGVYTRVADYLNWILDKIG